MPILAETEIVHPDLGSIRFDDGKRDPKISGGRDGQPKWVCRPDGWESDFEIYIPGGDRSPQDLERAIEAVNRRDQLHKSGRSLGDGDIVLSWIDLASEPSVVAFTDNEHVYTLWKGTLSKDWMISNFTKGRW